MAQRALKVIARPSHLIAFHALERVWKGAFANAALRECLAASWLDHTKKDVSFATLLIHGVLRNSRYLDHVLAELCHRPLDAGCPKVRIALHVGSYQILFLKRPTYCAASEAARLVHDREDRGYVKGVLRALTKRSAGHAAAPFSERSEAETFLGLSSETEIPCAVKNSLPEWLVQELAETLSEQNLQQWLESQRQVPGTSLRANRLRTSPTRLAEVLQGSGLTCRVSELFPDAVLLDDCAGCFTALPGFLEGDFIAQDAASQLVGYLVGPSPGQCVVDVCAAPGGKATHFAELMDDVGTVLALDLKPHRARLIESKARRLGLQSIVASVADATEASSMQSAVASLRRVDHVVLDAPCTGLGTLRRNPTLRGATQTRVAELCALQRQLLEVAAGVTPVGASLTYAVCTPTRAEGRVQIRSFLERHPEYELVPVRSQVLAPFVSSDGMPGQGSFLQTWTHQHGCDNFFAVKLHRHR